ncbi:MAG TPA: fibronectin type III domain-containing protein [Candidatus Saccharimonadales bacterium]|nr:fibronectin type III domain-containing protein [Candidatus Saccharimonadales bacterium]
MKGVTLSWDPNTEPDIAGYFLYIGTNSGNYSVSNWVGNVTANTPDGLVEGMEYFFVVTAYNTSGLESDFSNEIAVRIPAGGQNGPPEISNIPDIIIEAGSVTPPIPFVVDDSEVSPSNLLVYATSSDPSLVASNNIVFSGSGSNRFVSIRPSPGVSGSSEITISVSDGALVTSSSFLINVAAAQSGQTNNLQVSTVLQTNGLALVWPSVPSTVYQVFSKSNLADTLWTQLSDDITATDTTASWVDQTFQQTPVRFYRVLQAADSPAVQMLNNVSKKLALP